MHIPTLKELLAMHNEHLIPSIDQAKSDHSRASGGAERATKGKYVETFAANLIRRAWVDIGGKIQELSTTNTASTAIEVPLQRSYLKKVLKDKIIAEHIKDNIGEYTYKPKIDVPVIIRGNLVLAVECKSYTENAMLKRILFDGFLIRESRPQTDIILFQLESQLGGDYSNVLADKIFGSKESHTLMSYFNYKLSVVTLLEGDRKVDRPIHQPEFFKEMKMASLKKAYDLFSAKLRPHA